MGTDLNAPLGQNRKTPKSQKPVFSFGRILLGICVVALIGVSAWSMLRPSGLIEPKLEVVADATQPAEKPAGDTQADAGKPKTPQTSGALSGAHVEETLTDSGSIVTKFSPKQRDGKGPAFIEVGRTRGQDPRMATFPNDALLEDTPEGRLPVTGPDGLRPMDQYARPWSGARGIRIALVVGGLGLSQTGTQNALRVLPPEITMAFAASGNSLQRWMQEARRNGHEILLQVPFEPFDYPDNNPGPHTLRVDAGAKKNLTELRASLAQITNYTGIMNFLGGRFLSNADALEPVMRDIGRRGLLFLDDGTSAQSLTGTLADTIGVPHGFADMVVDGELDRTVILKKLDELERIARRNGSAIGVASAFDESVAAIAEWADEAGTRGIEFVGVSALVKDSQQQ
ncbi:divergent polysaccharide deacetylase family protein [Pararhizobium sp. BT-229]|uniref:divergent polysaccharide deacetylase family protein n=1 Tax=Pararhizobium sp. BT-229 TaxID=2986923 RepID=UPI0021F6ADDE|nr:divergent polysaccharide deacetylase family protein [Pararhizobium sp. BT-229]MCV9966333.1 divergent polysaccharide deacetylase family protein [Pararhizobium sp. BT-229]